MNGEFNIMACFVKAFRQSKRVLCLNSFRSVRGKSSFILWLKGRNKNQQRKLVLSDNPNGSIIAQKPADFQKSLEAFLNLKSDSITTVETEISIKIRNVSEAN
jgi:predicted transcriptional regulator